MAALIGIHVRRPVQALGGFREISQSAMQIKELEQSLAIVALSVGSVEQLA